MRAVVRADASATVGSGHLARSLTLAASLAAHGFAVDFATRSPSEHTRRWIERAGHRVLVIDGSEIPSTCGAAASAELVVVDGYAFGADLHAALRKPGRVVCVIDDLGDQPVAGDVVLNGNFFGERVAYDVQHRLLGPGFALVRDEFLPARATRESGAAKAGERAGLPPRILATMGGADPARATELFLETLTRIVDAHVRIVVGGANPRADVIREVAARVPGHVIEVLVDVDRMSDLMVWCDLAVVAAGSTCLELACVGVASIAIPVADNQVPVALELARRGLMRTTRRIEQVTSDALASEVRSLLDDPAGHLRMEMAQRASVDGQGAGRAAAALVSLVRGG
jgi:UDP-2,4-diacetamido-2,4,6-trideoxy-beta-L-altropyranose hydrolase